MQSITALEKDPYFRLKLILVCLSVAVLVSIIYVTVVYKMAADIVTTTEFNAAMTEAKNLQYVIDTHTLDVAKRRVKAILKQHYADNVSENEVAYGFLMLNTPTPFSFSNLPSHTIRSITSQTSIHNETTNQGVVDVDGQEYVWIHLKSKKNADILLIKSAQSISLAVDYITQRLIITSIITFWIAVWLALFLATRINNEVQAKNDALAHIATHDTLTKLPNRLHLFSICKIEIQDLIAKQSIHSEQKSGALLLIDLNNFKEINDAYGHNIGDEVLIGFSQRIQKVLSDKEVLVRMGGDEFVIWGRELDESTALALSNQIQVACHNTLIINDLSIEINPSIGISLLFQHATDLDNLMTNADLAMYQSKSNHLGPVIYDGTLGASYLYAAKLRGDLSEAIIKDQIFLLYQPKIELKTGRLIGVEALARWNHPIEGMISPIHFIPLIEKSVHIHKFTRYVIEKSIKQVKQWQNNGIETTIAVNISPYNLLDDDFVEDIGLLLETHQVPVSSLEVELTETAMMCDISSTKSSLQKLRKLGLSVAIDDFGTGLSSLSYISQLDTNVIKIDRSFVMDMNTNHHNLAIVEAIVGLSNRLNWDVVAEGIETKEQLQTLSALGCQYGQGYYFERPLPEENVTSLLLENKHYSI
ncbi:putative bifunctional diguanylate cyclase/phosphodiesterase [Marinomonas sp. 2405UD68-3]|uniref:putative bifunctional diguanylate cyclase/phosphodiesterase n=1 Tax=Marinomonas sp. 2405UD68-3 TaxID=3391835 RepID=UPI0039C95275